MRVLCWIQQSRQSRQELIGQARWQLQEAKNKLSEVVRRAREEGPQTITVRGEDAVVVVDAAGYRPAQDEPSPARENLVEFFQNWSEVMEGIDLDLWPRTVDPERPNPFEDAE